MQFGFLGFGQRSVGGGILAPLGARCACCCCGSGLRGCDGGVAAGGGGGGGGWCAGT